MPRLQKIPSGLGGLLLALSFLPELQEQRQQFALRTLIGRSEANGFPKMRFRFRKLLCPYGFFAQQRVRNG